jgi:hypothetical protein
MVITHSNVYYILTEIIQYQQTMFIMTVTFVSEPNNYKDFNMLYQTYTINGQVSFSIGTVALQLQDLYVITCQCILHYDQNYTISTNQFDNDSRFRYGIK